MYIYIYTLISNISIDVIWQPFMGAVPAFKTEPYPPTGFTTGHHYAEIAVAFPNLRGL